MAAAAQTSERAVLRWETGTAVPGIRKIQLLAVHFGMSEEILQRKRREAQTLRKAERDTLARKKSGLYRGRKKAGMSRKEAAEAAGITALQLRKWEENLQACPSEVKSRLKEIYRNAEKTGEDSEFCYMTNLRIKKHISADTIAEMCGIGKMEYLLYEWEDRLPCRFLPLYSKACGISRRKAAKHCSVKRFLSCTAHGEYIRKWIRLSGMTTAAVCRAAGVTRSAISAYSTGKMCPAADTLSRIAQAAGVKPEDLLCPPSAIKKPVFLKKMISDAPVNKDSVSGKMLREFRIRNGYTQRQIAEKVGVTTMTITNWELGRTVPSGKKLEALLLLGADLTEEQDTAT